MQIINKTQGTVLASKVFLAKGFWARTRGLLGKKALAPGEALVIFYCQAIHMFFMRFSIDVVFVDKTQRVVGLVRGIKPFCMSPVFFKAFWAIELEAGAIERTRTALGDILEAGLLDIV